MLVLGYFSNYTTMSNIHFAKISQTRATAA
jgi:hypothetical protein